MDNRCGEDEVKWASKSIANIILSMIQNKFTGKVIIHFTEGTAVKIEKHETIK